ncbi:MAG: hypothetical protein L3J02_08025, partial [Henriciella sp.]|nr:hypothetical protein [Henriciella sp.]
MERLDVGLGFGARPVRRPAFDRLGPNGRLILVPGGEAVVLEVMPDDCFAIFDPAGGQGVGITAFDSTGSSSLDLLTFSEDAPQAGEIPLPALNPVQRNTLDQICADIRNANSYTTVRTDPGKVIEDEVNTPGLLIISAPGNAGSVGEPGFPTDLEIHLQRPFRVGSLLIPE